MKGYLICAHSFFPHSPIREQEIFNSYLTKEPLRTAIFLAREEVNPKEQFASFIYYSCKILLSNGGKQGFLRDPIDVKINGKMPFLLCKSSQQIGDNWYKSFVENKLTVAKIALKHLNEEKAYAVILRSIAYSIYFFTPYLYIFLIAKYVKVMRFIFLI